MIPVIAIRPQPGCDATVYAAGALGLDARGFPLFNVEAVDWDAPDPANIDALLIGSANALRHGGEALALYRGKPAYAVGLVTAEAAHTAGLDVAAVGSGGLQSLLGDIAPGHRHLLRLAGRERIRLAPPADTEIVERVVYANNRLAMPPELVALLRAPAVVLLHSAEAARHFSAECTQLGVDRAQISLVTIGPRVSKVAGSGWAAVTAAATPDEQALLAQAVELCQEHDGLGSGQDNRMQDETLSQAKLAPRRKGAWRMVLLVALIAFLFGGSLVGWLAWQSGLDFGKLLGISHPAVTERMAASAPPAPPTTMPNTTVSAQLPLAITEKALEERLSSLEERLTKLDLQAEAASGNAARAEGLLIALAARRSIERGVPLGYLEYQLKLRFADAQPNAVQTIIAAGQQPVTLDQLSGQLGTMAVSLSSTPKDESAWNRVKRELGGLIVIRHDSAPVPDPESRLTRAKLYLHEGKIEDAIAEVGRLPSASGGNTWIASARRYAAAQRALDLIETTALLEPRRLQDSKGEKVEQVSPLAEPAADKAA